MENVYFIHIIRMVEDILKTRLMVKRAMKDYKDDKVGMGEVDELIISAYSEYPMKYAYGFVLLSFHYCFGQFCVIDFYPYSV